MPTISPNTCELAPARNHGTVTLSGALRAVVSDLASRHGVYALVVGGQVCVRAGSLTVECGPLDGTGPWTLSVRDDLPVQVSIDRSPFNVFEQQDFRVCLPEHVAKAFLTSIQSLRVHSPDNYWGFLLSNALTKSEGLWSKWGSHCRFITPVDLGAIDEMVGALARMTKDPNDQKRFDPADLAWLNTILPMAKTWRRHSGVNHVLDFITGIHGLIAEGRLEGPSPGEETCPVVRALHRLVTTPDF